MTALCLRPRPGLLWIVMRELHDLRGKPLLVAVELADLHLITTLRVESVDPCQGDVLPKDRRAHASGDDANLCLANMNAVAMANCVIGIDLNADKLAARVFLALDQRLLANEVVAFRFQWHGKTD